MCAVLSVSLENLCTESSGNTYVTDRGNNRVQKFDSNGKFITKCGSMGSNEGQFVNPRGITLDSSGNVYVVEHYGHHDCTVLLA